MTPVNFLVCEQIKQIYYNVFLWALRDNGVFLVFMLSLWTAGSSFLLYAQTWEKAQSTHKSIYPKMSN